MYNYIDVCKKHLDQLVKKGGKIVGKVNGGKYCDFMCNERALYVVKIKEDVIPWKLWY